jgi:predicted ATP-dependent serine protease
MNEDIMPRSFADVEVLEAEWLWDGIIPSATVTVLAAPGGTGKSLAMLDVAARVSAGREMPGCPQDSAQAPQVVVYVSLEDSAECSLVKRLDAAGADLGNVLDASENANGEPFDIVRDSAWLRRVVSESAAALVVVDTLAAASPVSLSSPVAIRAKVMGPMLDLAKKTGAAVVLVHHTTKNAKVIAGSKAITDSVRQVLLIAPDGNDPRIRVLNVEKTNLGSKSGAMFRISAAGTCEWIAQGEKNARPEDTARARVTAVMSGLEHTGQWISAQSGVSYPTVRVTLSRMVKAGTVICDKTNAYRLVISDGSGIALREAA